jgi:DNA polymerase I-like protein with 3'-5' exonuclease and polymerase domains/uracil-DNA glycosylase
MGARCDECPLVNERPVPPQIPHGKTKLVIVGEGPGRTEGHTGIPFTGPSGRLLDQLLRRNGMQRAEAHVTNTHLCLDGPTLVRMAGGSTMRINEIVKRKYRGQVLTVEADGSLGVRPIVGWHRNLRGRRRLVRLTHEFSKGNPQGSARTHLTEEHLVLTSEGWRKAREVDGLLIATGDRAPTGAALEVAIGTLLGDGSIPRTQSGYLCVCHAVDQAEYCRLKATVLGATTFSAPGHHGWQAKEGFRTYSSGFFHQMRRTFYPKGKKRIPPEIASNLSALSLAIWFLDDGYMRHRSNRSPRAEICGAAFSRSDLARIVRRLRERFSLDCKVNRKGPARIQFTAQGSFRLSLLIAEFVPPSMEYKLCPEHRGVFDPYAFRATSGPFFARARVQSVSIRPRLVYCIDVEKTHNFITTTVVAHNCRSRTEQEIPEAIVCCAPRLFRELGEIERRVPIAALGKAASKALLGTSSILRARGFVWELPGLDEKKLAAVERVLAPPKPKKPKKEALTPLSAWARQQRRKEIDVAKMELHAKQNVARLKLLRHAVAGRVALPMLHPAFILRSEIWGSVLAIDMERFGRVVRGELRPKHLEDSAPFEIVSSPKALRRALRKLKSTVTVDIETDGADPLVCKILCVGLGDTRRTIIAYPFLRTMVPVLTEGFARRTVVGHNIFTFDAIALRRYGVSLKPAQIEDTLVAHHGFASHLPKSLLHVASAFTDASPWKHKAKGEGKTVKGLPHELSAQDLTRYCASDVILTALSWDRMQKDLEPERHVYEVDKGMAQLCAEMRVVGIGFDAVRAKELRVILRKRMNTLLSEMRRLVRDPGFNPQKPGDIRNALYGVLGYRKITITPTGLPSTARAVLEALRGQETSVGRLSDMILRWRGAAKIRSTYLNPTVLEDGRVHADWRLGPVSGRLACRLMTLPRYTRDKDGTIDAINRVRECFLATVGMVLVYFDLSQAEMRVAAHLSQCARFIETCKGDVHAGNAKVLFPDAAAQGWLDGKEAKEGKGKRFRDIAKNAGFAVTYLAEWETVYAYLTSHGFPVSPSDVRTMLDRLHEAYRGYFEFVDDNVEFVKRHGWLRTFGLGRIRWFGRYPIPTEVANYPIQAGIADHMNERLLRLRGALPKKARIVAQIHDAAIIECPEKDTEKVKGLVREMFAPPVVVPNRPPFSIPIDLKTGSRWSDFA